jgi:hypothetical protein
MVLGISGSLGWAVREAAGQAAPAPPTHIGVERTIDSMRLAWSRPGARPEPNADGWNRLFNTLLEQLQAYAGTEDEAVRLTALNRVSEIQSALETVTWPPAATLRAEVRAWLRPRGRLAWARRQLSDTVESLPPATDPAAPANRRRWLDFVRNDLGGVLRAYDGAQTVQQRQEALRRLHEVLANLHRQNQRQQSQARTWAPSWELEAATNDLFNRPNLDTAADVATVQAEFDVNLVTTGTVIHEGYTSMVTAGPKTGFGLIPLDGGIGFYNSQSMFFVTLIHDFQQRLAQDPQGQKATKLYDFTARTYDWSHLTVTKTITPDGLSLSPSLTHNIHAVICSAPTQGNGLKRGIAALIGMNQDRITEKVKEGALPRFRQEIPQETLEEVLERSSVKQAKWNADLRSKYLPGNDTAQVGDFLIKQLSMASRPEAIYAGGRFEWRGAPDQRGADMPRPPSLASTILPGVTVDLHLGSLLTSAAGGIWRQDRFRSMQNVMIQTKTVPPGTPPKDAVEVRENISFADYIKAVDAVRNAHDPRMQALRIARPQQPPEFSTDARGYLVALVRDFQLDAPAPDPRSGGAMLGVPARVLRYKVPLVEVALSYQLDETPPGSLQLKVKVQEFSPGTGGEVLAIKDDENQAKPLTRFRSAIVMTALVARMRSQNIDINLNQLQLPGFSIRSVSPLDPSGWARINLVRTGGTPLQQTLLALDVLPGPTHGPAVPGSTTPSPTGAPPGATGSTEAAAGTTPVTVGSRWHEAGGRMGEVTSGLAALGSWEPLGGPTGWALRGLPGAGPRPSPR